MPTLVALTNEEVTTIFTTNLVLLHTVEFRSYQRNDQVTPQDMVHGIPGVVEDEQASNFITKVTTPPGYDEMRYCLPFKATLIRVIACSDVPPGVGKSIRYTYVRNTGTISFVDLAGDDYSVSKDHAVACSPGDRFHVSHEPTGPPNPGSSLFYFVWRYTPDDQ